jgi:hypothetical protein
LFLFFVVNRFGIASSSSPNPCFLAPRTYLTPQTRGHHIADLDPLGINLADLDATIAPELQLATYRFGKKTKQKNHSSLANFFALFNPLDLVLVVLICFFDIWFLWIKPTVAESCVCLLFTVPLKKPIEKQ